LHFKFKKSSSREKRIFYCCIAGIAVFSLFITLCSWHVNREAGPFLYDSFESVPYNDIGLILGISRTDNNVPNEYFDYRIEAAVKLYKKGKVKYLLISGTADPAASYDEIIDMTKALRKRGIPDGVILSDKSGNRTLDSIIRAKELLGLKRFTIISQEDQNMRAQYIARYYGMDTVGFNAMTPDLFISRWEVELHEWLAKVKMMLDLYILKTRPEVSGKNGISVPAACIREKVISNL
jgi:SanA protein